MLKSSFLNIPAEVILYICEPYFYFELNKTELVLSSTVSFLDLPDLASLAQLSHRLERLSLDPALHRNRIRITAPSRVQHSLFGQGPLGVAFRPTVADLVQRNVIRGLSIERRWRNGFYLYSQPVRGLQV
jgi:hypothetical protein